MALPQVPLLTPPAEKAPSQTTLLVRGTKCSSCLSLSSGLQFPASHRVIHTSQSQPPVGTRGSPPSWRHKACLPQPRSSCSRVQDWCDLACDAASSPGGEALWLINCCPFSLSRVVFGHPIKLRVDSLPRHQVTKTTAFLHKPSLTHLFQGRIGHPSSLPHSLYWVSFYLSNQPSHCLCISVLLVQMESWLKVAEFLLCVYISGSEGSAGT